MLIAKAPGTTFGKAVWLALAACLGSVAYASNSIVDGDDDADPLGVDPIDEISAETATLESEDIPGASGEENAVRAALPGISEDQIRIYRREMYRTDI